MIIVVQYCKQFGEEFTLMTSIINFNFFIILMMTVFLFIYLLKFLITSWEILLDTSNMSDEEVNEYIKNTFVYHALNIVSHSVGMFFAFNMVDYYIILN